MSIDLIKLWFERALPATCAENFTARKQMTQIGVHFEEVSEMLNSLGIRSAEIEDLASDFKAGCPPNFEVNRTELLDALCDQIVTAVGVAHLFGMNIAGALAEVNSSNWSKFDDKGMPIFDLNGKIKKGPNYKKPDLRGFA